MEEHKVELCKCGAWKPPNRPCLNEKLIQYGQEVIGAYGECGGVHCPFCSTRQYHNGERDDIVTCAICDTDFLLPPGYYRRAK